MTQHTALPALHVGRGYRYGNLTWFPVWSDAPELERRYTTDIARLEISELEAETVPHLKVRNPGDTSVVVFEGSVFVGGFQTRTLTKTSFVPAATEAVLPVLCVESQRWGGHGRSHRVGDMIAPSRVRSAARGVTREPARAPQNARQGQVWNQVASYQARHSAPAPTHSLADINQHVRNRAMDEETIPEVKALPGQRGVIIASLGQPMSMELFDHPDTLAERLQALLESVRLDVLDQGYVETPSRRARRFADRVLRAGLVEGDRQESMRVFEAPANNYVASDAVGVDDDILHLSCLNPRHKLVLAA